LGPRRADGSRSRPGGGVPHRRRRLLRLPGVHAASYAFLLKGQAYRWLWLPLALTPPALFDLAWNAWRTNELKNRFGSLAIVVALGLTNFVPLEFATLLFFVPVFFYGFMSFAKPWSLTDKLSWTLLGSVLVGIAVWGVYRVWIYFALNEELVEQSSYLTMFEIVVAALTPGILLPLALFAAVVFHRQIVGVRQAMACLVAAALIQTGLFAWTCTEHFRSHHPLGSELRFVEAFLKERRADSPRPMCIYSNYGQLGQYWVEWRTQSFYDCFQLAGFVFNRDTAIEGKRRVSAVAPFEAAALSKGSWDLFPDMCKAKIEGWLELSVKDTQPNQHDLFRLANEPSIDFIILFKTHVDDLAIARHGNVSIYDCRALRESRIACRDARGASCQLASSSSDD